MFDPWVDQFLLRSLSITEGIECPKFRCISSSACAEECCGIRKPPAAALSWLRCVGFS